MTDHTILRRISLILFILSLIMLSVHMETIVQFNRQGFHFHGNNESGEIRMEIDSRKDSTSTWLKRSFLLNKQVVDLTGQTIDGTLQNDSSDAIQDWELRINILGDCFINQAWNGEVEIHQYSGTKNEKVQRLNLQNYKLEDVTFEYQYDGDLLIPLQEGDYVLYYPSTRFSEMPLAGGDDVRIGMIFYYLDQLDLSDYDVQYHLHRTFVQGTTFYPFIILASLWVLSIITYTVVVFAYRRARKEMELRKSGIFCMSDIYDVIYIIHLPDGEMTPVSVGDKIERTRQKNKTAKEIMSDMVTQDIDEQSREWMLSFVDTDTLPERLRERNSLVREFYSNKYGWCSIRFFAMDRVEGKPVENVVLAVQNINEEKKELEAITAKIVKAESASKSRIDFMDHFASDLNLPLQALLSRIERIMQESPDDPVRGCARDARGIAVRLLSLTEGLADSTGLQAGSIHLKMESYSLRQLLLSALQAVLPLAKQQHTALELDIAEGIPDLLQGDSRMLEEALVNLLFGLLPSADGERLLLSVYGKTLNEKVHLLFSVRAFLKQKEEIEWSDGGLPDGGEPAGLAGLNMEVVHDLAARMGSSLQPVRSPADRKEFYFEIEQQILDSAPMGKITLEDAEQR